MSNTIGTQHEASQIILSYAEEMQDRGFNYDIYQKPKDIRDMSLFDLAELIARINNGGEMPDNINIQVINIIRNTIALAGQGYVK